MKTLKHIALSALFGTGILAGIVFMIVATSILENFQVFPHDADGGCALLMIEMVIAFFAASVVGLLCFRRVHFGV
jgi:uncharacterized BrkB/YihY/UPF0761 family membrane protein